MVITFTANLFQPSHQVTMMVMITRAQARGNQPPVKNFPRQEPKKLQSITQKPRQSGRAWVKLQPQIFLVMA